MFSGRLQWTFSLPAVGSEARIWLPYAVSNAAQTVRNCSLQLPVGCAPPLVYCDERFGTAALTFALTACEAPRQVGFGCCVTRRAVLPPSTDTLRSADCVPLDTVANQLWLQETSRMSMKVVRLRLEMVMKDANYPTSTLGRLRAIYDWVCGYMSRDPNCKGCGDGDVCVLLERKTGKCTDIHSVVVALARAAGIACREVFGVRLGNKAFAEGDAKSIDVSGWQHCWVEALVPGVGWVSMDPSDVLKDALSLKISKDSEAFAELKEKYWLQLDPFRVALAIGRDVEIGPTVQNTFQYPVIQLDDLIVDQVASCDYFKIELLKE